MMHVDLPDRKEITLCEAVTAFVYGKAYTVVEYQERFVDTPQTSERTSKAKELLAQLQQAAYAGRVKFRAIQEGADAADGYKDIDPLYFYTNPFFHWTQDVIMELENESSRPWYYVHLDREQYASLLRHMNVEVKTKIYKTGVAGKPTSLHIVEPEAERRLAAGEYPETLAAFSRDLAAWLKDTHPEAPSMTEKTICNVFRDMWNARRPK
jgi:hypothetical protein